MEENKNFHELSYKLQKERTFIEDKEKDNRTFQWSHKDTADYWRHERMYSSMDILIKLYPDAKWLTIGDGRYGTDANYLISKNAKHVLATDIFCDFLKQAKEDNFITDYKEENAERMSFADNEFDFVVCKESYHHFPRPMIAVYEMLRVAKIAVIIIEPNDPNIFIPYDWNLKTSLRWFNQKAANVIRYFAKKKAQGIYNFGGFEELGNYIYTVSKREMEKVAYGINLKYVAFKGLNDVYIEGVEEQKANNESPLFNKINDEINKLNELCEKGLANYNILVSFIFKSNPDNDKINTLRKNGFEVRKLVDNPYLEKLK